MKGAGPARRGPNEKRRDRVALGVRLDGDLLPGLVQTDGGDLASATVTLQSSEEVEDAWSSSTRAELVFGRRMPDGRSYLEIQRDPVLGYRVWAADHGVHMLAPDGSTCRSALPDQPEWLAPRLLSSQVLPLLATLNGLEILHAGGVVVGGRLVALVAASGTGKSATGAHLIAQGGSFFADDVLALGLSQGRVVAHPGPRLINLDERIVQSLPAEARPSLGRCIGTSDKVHFVPNVHSFARPLAAVLFLERQATAGATLIERLDEGARSLLGAAYISYVSSPQRLLGQLEIAATTARSVPLARVCIRGEGPPRVAARIIEWTARLP